MPDTSPDIAKQARDLADQLLASGLSPQQVIDAITGEAGKVVPLRVRRAPSYAEPPDVVRHFRVRVDIDGATPPIWRRLELRGDLRLDQVHEVLQHAFGWTNSHLHAFRTSNDPLVDRFITQFDLEEGEEGVLETEIRLDQVLAEPGDRLHYEYDFGDSWDHTATVEQVLPDDPGAPAARVLDGRRACPPEDCGGVHGYHEMLEGMADPSAADDWLRRRVDRLPEDFEPDEFDLASHDAAVRSSLRLAHSAVLPDEPSDDFADLVRRTPWGSMFALPELIASAELRAEPRCTREQRLDLVAPYLLLLDLVRRDGVPLTQAGYLKPEIVTTLAEALGREDSWGKANREDLTPPVARLRQTATAMGLIRKYRGRLLLTPQGRAVAGDAEGLWSVIASSLPRGLQPAERHAGVLALLAVAAGQDPYEVLTTAGPQLMEEAGWRRRDGEPLDGHDVFDLGRATVEVLWVVNRERRRGAVLPAARELARAALAHEGR